MRVIISCGGTGGHIYPAIAIADKIKEKDPTSEILFIGTKRGMENRLVPAAGYNIVGIDASGFSRKHLLENFKTVHDAAQGSMEADKIIKDFKPDIAIGTGAYVTGSVLLRAHRNNIPCFIHEQNAVPGLTNKLVSRFADKVFISFRGTEGVFKHPDRVIFSGNPVRNAFLHLDKDECRKELGYSDDDIVILATGGSLGAEMVNREVVKLIEAKKDPRVKIIFVTGKIYYDSYKDKGNSSAVIMDYANNMPVLMQAADCVISRAGAIAVSELLCCGKPSVLVPSPNVTNNHQFHNAKAVADAGAAILIEESELSDDKAVLADRVLKLISDRECLKNMGKNAKLLGKIDAADIIFENLHK